MMYFDFVDTITPYSINWSTLIYYRSNAAYKMLINICFLAIKGLLLTTETGEYKLAKFLDDQQMHRLYEKFVLSFYQREYPELAACAAHIDWNVDDFVIDSLPQMKTDIMLMKGEKTLIIDTKYYGRTMQKNPQFDKATLISGNLYQIFTYVKNRDMHNTGNVSGVLLYAKTDEAMTPDNDYRMSGNRISVKTLDLSADWEEINSQLDGLVKLLDVV